MDQRILLLLGLSIINSGLAMDEQMTALIARYQRESDLIDDKDAQISSLTVHHPQQDQKMELLKLGNAYYVRKKELILVGDERIPWSATIGLSHGEPKEEDYAIGYHILKLLKHRWLRELSMLPKVELRQLTMHKCAAAPEPEMRATLDAPLAEQKDKVDEQEQATIKLQESRIKDLELLADRQSDELVLRRATLQKLQQRENWKFYLTAGAASSIGILLGVVLIRMLHECECTE